MPNVPAGGKVTDLSTMADKLVALFGALSARTISPGQPIPPSPQLAEQEQGPRQFQYPVSVNTQTQPRREYPGLTPFDQLRALASNYDVAALCIATRIEELCGLEWAIVAKDKKAAAAEAGTVDALTAWFASPDKVNDFSSWLSMALYDLFVLDALTIYPKPDRGGGLWGLEVVDGATIKPLLDTRGQVAAYQQILYGLPWGNYERAADVDDDDFPTFSNQELIYRPRWVRSFTPYGFPPSEWVILRVNTALRKQTFDLARFTDGNIPAALASPPDGLLNPDQVAAFQDNFNAYLQGNDAARRRITFLPWAAKLQLLGELSEGGRYESSLDEWMLKITCAAYGTPPSEIGFTSDVNKATSQGQADINERRGLRPLARWLKHLFDDVIQQRHGQPQLEWQWQFGEVEDRGVTATTDKTYIETGVVAPAEVRTLRFPDLDGPAPQPPMPQSPQPQPAASGAPETFARYASPILVKVAADDDERPTEPPDDDARRDAEARVHDALARAYTAQERAVRAALSDSVAAQPSVPPQVWQDAEQALASALLPVFDDVASEAAQLGLRALPVGVDWAQVNMAVLQLAQERARALASETTETSRAQVSALIADWVQHGGTLDDLVARVKRVWTGPRADVAAITEVTRLYADANVAAWRASGVVAGWSWQTSADEAVCPICGPLQGRRFGFDDPRPPAHARCRCWVTPEVD